jgi:hypothetical protein
MRIISHRGNGFGLESNTLAAFEAGFRLGFGIETDIRDYRGRLVISHDIGNDESADAEELFALAARHPNCEMAINVKSDGIAALLGEGLRRYGITNYFAFDMSVPQMIEYGGAGIKFFSRQSEYEPCPVLLESAAGVWIDAFQEYGWIDSESIDSYIAAGKSVCIVSPELHGRDCADFWRGLKGFDCENLALCTDCPAEADKFFNKGENR